jgi:hypothetical protein
MNLIETICVLMLGFVILKISVERIQSNRRIKKLKEKR